MNYKKIVILLFTQLLILSIVSNTSLLNALEITNGIEYSNIIDIDIIKLQSSDNLNNITEAMNLNIYNQSATFEGYNLVQTMRNYVIPGDPCIYSRVAYGINIFDMEGNVIKYLDNYRALYAKSYNSTHFITDGCPVAQNMSLLNVFTGEYTILPVSRGNHDAVYNPITETIMILHTVVTDEVWDGLNVSYQNLREYSFNGELLWEWDATTHMLFDPIKHTSIGFNDTFAGKADWMHTTSLVWDFETDEILMMVRNHDTLYKIDKTSGNILWSAGRLGTFDVYDANGDETDTIWCHPHGLEQLGPDRYIIFDNDARNMSNTDSMDLLNGYSRYLEFSINEDEETINEVWSYVGPDDTYYFPRSGGDCDRLPNGNTLGIFGSKGKATSVYNNTHPLYYTEVNEKGEIVWEVELTNTSEYAFQSYNLERYYSSPLVDIDESSYTGSNKENSTIKLRTWNCFREHYSSPATIKIMQDDDTLATQDFEFLPHWQATNLELNITDLDKGSYDLKVVVENSDGVSTTVEITLEITRASNGFGLLITSIPLFVLAAFTVIKRKGKEN